MTFPLFLIILTSITGLYWLVDSLVFKRNRTGDEPILVEYARQFFPVLFVVVLLRSFIFEPFRIPSGSMIPTLLVGDFILVSKFSYGVRLPVVHTKIIETGKPQNGDVAVFRYPADPKVDYIKRVIGIPGDKITLRGKELLINGEAVDYSEKQAYVMPGTDDIMEKVSLRSETFASGTHNILVENLERGLPTPSRNLGWKDAEIVLSDTGGIEANLVGKAKYIWMHWNSGILWSRLGESIQ